MLFYNIFLNIFSIIYETIVKYYFTSFQKEHSIAIYNLALYYDVEKNYTNAVKYYLMAI